MSAETIRLSIPAEPTYARSVRMMAANLAVVCGMGVDTVEDVRMAAEEGFIYSCSTKPDTCEVAFEISSEHIGMEFSLGEAGAQDDSVEYARLLLAAVCDEFDVAEDGTRLHLLMRALG